MVVMASQCVTGRWSVYVLHLSLETTAPVLLRAGIWSLHPFTHPGMIQLGEWLPMHWRELKQLQRRQLARARPE